MEPTTLTDVALTPDELRRYQRHLTLPEVGVAGQKKLKAASVLLVGAGGLGSPLALYLAAAGVGRLGLVDFDVVDETNLQRQVLHGTKDVGRSKLASARDRLLDVNPHVQLDLHEVRLTSENALDLIAGYDLVADVVLTLDKTNPQVAARLLGAFGSWQRLEQRRRERAGQALSRVADTPDLSPDVYEIATKSLA